MLISPLIKPGTTTDTFYNHYSWLRTMEDIFQVSDGKVTRQAPRRVGVGRRRRGRATSATPRSRAWRPFGPDVFNNVRGHNGDH